MQTYQWINWVCGWNWNEHDVVGRKDAVLSLVHQVDRAWDQVLMMEIASVHVDGM